MQNPTEKHLQAVKHILHYLKGTASLRLFFKKEGSLELFGFTDTDYVGDIEDRKNTSSYVFRLGSILLFSTIEAKFVAASSSPCQATWLGKILEQLQFINSAIKLSKNPVIHKRNKHKNVKYHFSRDFTKDGMIDLVFCTSEDQVVDLFTKSLKIFDISEVKETPWSLFDGCLVIKETLFLQL
ncbi:retrovirus-related Pol polyprotein from transposon TNT 1-94 [Gossypium australe]|uniref:Retrovirus-related Pol polyprotein from transposon TNT 1-94 n=1 Tax=Gossypium australe TaxID=47621 RepID=A0A5B6VU16_9ROSI|nr:retrovirus-related Pol polyprotein from transposon TNT 1-94 [Gossypium australe]